MTNISLRLMSRFCGIYGLGLLIGSCMLLLNLSYERHGTMAPLWDFQWKAILTANVLLLALLLGLSYWRLKLVLRFFQGIDRIDGSRKAFERLHRFPFELFWGTAGLFFLLSLLHRGIVPLWLEGEPLNSLPEAGLGMLTETGLAVTIAIMLFTAVRGVLRPYYMTIGITEPVASGKGSILYILVLAFVSCFLAALVQIIDYGIHFGKAHPSTDPVSFLSLAALYVLFVFLIFCLPIWQFRRDLKLLIRSIGSLQRAGRESMHGAVPVMSKDEIGQLTGSFNELQASIRAQYDELDKQMRLAYNIQQKLLPNERPVAEGLDIAAMCRQCREVGGDFYDYMALDDRRVAIVIGDVTGKGMPAALLMSAVMVLWRTEMLKGGGIEEVAGRINRSVYETLQGELFVTLGLAVFDVAERKLDYVSAGHMAPYLLESGKLRQLNVSSLPLGLDPERKYRKISIDLHPGELIVFYTDGVIEAHAEYGGMVGFERWEQWLLQIDVTGPLQRQLELLAERLPAVNSGSAYDDDRTVVLVRWHGLEPSRL